MNANLYVSSNPELEAELKGKIANAEQRLQELANRKVEAKTQGEKISIGFETKKVQMHLDSYKAQMPKAKLDAEVAAEYCIEQLDRESDK
jgi:hypothetical protein